MQGQLLDSKKGSVDRDCLYGLRTLAQIPMHKVSGQYGATIESAADLATLYSTALVESHLPTAHQSQKHFHPRTGTQPITPGVGHHLYHDAQGHSSRGTRDTAAPGGRLKDRFRSGPGREARLGSDGLRG